MSSAPPAVDRENERAASLTIPMVIAAVYLLAQVATATRYGYFRDALYYLACSHHLAWGYVDQPPLIVLFAWLARHTFGVSLRALLLWPALAGAARIVLIAALARELGARKFGTALAAALGAAPGVWFAIDHQFAMNAFEPLFWTGCAFAFVRMTRTGNPRWWLAFGLIAGLGLENKYSMAAFAFFLLCGVLLTPQRKFLFSRWILAGGAIALLLFLPNLLWNIQHHWPFLELMRNIRASGRDVVLSPAAFVVQQILLMNPLTLPFWLAGLSFYFSPAGKQFRALGWAFLFTVGFFLLAHGKNYYSVPVYPLVLAAGGVAVERVLSKSYFHAHARLQAALRTATFAWLFIAIVLFLPLVLPVLPIEAFLRYQQHLPFVVPKTEHNYADASLPQHYGDEFGWEEIVERVAAVYQSLSPEEQSRTAIFTGNYGEAAAIDFFGSRYGLPKAICTHQNYFLWGPRDYHGEIVIRIGSKPEDAEKYYQSVQVAATLNNPYSMPEEKNPILLCRHRKKDLQTDWPTLKKWN
ncbi:MAG TPA: glycosyltransferase family 39 protein [Candidatus Acidoferrum sp.]